MSRPTASRAAKPATIYRRNKVVAGADRPPISDESSDEDAEATPAVAAPKLLSTADKRLEGFTIRDEPAKPLVADLKQLRAPSRRPADRSDEDVKPVLRKPLDAIAPDGSVAPAAGGADSEYETDTGDEESESESEEEAPKPIFKPVFVSKRARVTVAKPPEVLQQEADEAYERELEERKRASHQLAGEAVLRTLADKETEEKFPDVDDTDGLDPEGEFEAWKLRELGRLKRDTEATYAREKEREEIERRRALPESIRLKDDLAFAQSTRDNKSKGQHVFMQKYHHRGVFYTEEGITQRDTSAPTESMHMDVSSLPKAMQVRQGKFGKRGQTKYTHLVDQDTSSKDAGWSSAMGGKGSSMACHNCGGPHMKRDCPELNHAGPSGANGSAASGGGDRGYSDRVRSDPRREDAFDRGGDRRRSSRSRSTSLERGRGDRDKRRRLD